MAMLDYRRVHENGLEIIIFHPSKNLKKTLLIDTPPISLKVKPNHDTVWYQKDLSKCVFGELEFVSLGNFQTLRIRKPLESG